MPASNSTMTDELLREARGGDDLARQRLLARHRPRLLRMVAVHLDRRLAARVDPSDVVQEALTEADRSLDDYLRRPNVPFYPWLRRFAWERLLEAHRHHLRAKRRSVTREEPADLQLPGRSAARLADRLLSSGASPIHRLILSELRQRVRAALDRLPPRDREILVLRYLEQLTTAEIASVLRLAEGAVRTRHVRALDRLRRLLDDDHPEVPR
jgi:RNA polymerase sigma-70 factor (ECF subfamily)